MLDKADVDHIGDGAEIWEKAVRKIHGGTMPPLGMPRPDQASLDAFVSSLETSLDRAAISRPEPGRAPLHRLNRTEYQNAIRDLLALDIDVGLAASRRRREQRIRQHRRRSESLAVTAGTISVSVANRQQPRDRRPRPSVP